MKLTFFEEPELEFGNGGTHVDMRYGLAQYGPLDVGDTKAPTQLRLGLIGTDETIRAMREWLERCKPGIGRKDSKLVNLFPNFPGFTSDVAFRSSLSFHDRWCAPIRQREVDAVIAHSDGDETVRESVAMFVDRAADLVQQGGPMVLVCLPPHDLLTAVDERRGAPDLDTQEIDEGSEPGDGNQPATIDFHDLLKAEGMRVAVPLQMVRPKTYGGAQGKRRQQSKRKTSTQLQDEATRAWNIHTALYYKAGGIPWRLLRDAAELTTCFVGISFYRTLDKSRLLTSVAQVFNERGEGVIVKGAQAQLDKNDKTPHLSSTDAHALLKQAISVYRREHRTIPARIVVHKTSRVLLEEAEGFDAAAKEQAIDTVEILTVRRSFARVFREGTYPPLRGTFIELQKTSGLLYLKGSVDFFRTYPGLYVPRPLEINVHRADTPLQQLGSEMLALSKLNWNNTQFDGGEPITVRAARRVGDILKCIANNGTVQPTFRFFM